MLRYNISYYSLIMLSSLFANISFSPFPYIISHSLAYPLQVNRISILVSVLLSLLLARTRTGVCTLTYTLEFGVLLVVI